MDESPETSYSRAVKKTFLEKFRKKDFEKERIHSRFRRGTYFNMSPRYGWQSPSSMSAASSSTRNSNVNFEHFSDDDDDVPLESQSSTAASVTTKINKIKTELTNFFKR
ncbi:hypothetical protein Bhyg_12502, partial [Pseudolycoriella hygida]